MSGPQRFCREGVAWKHLQHPNILPLLGVTVNEYRFALVSEWMENGNINEFAERDHRINRSELVCHNLTSAGPTLMHYLVGWCCKWFEVYAQPPHSTRRSERGTEFTQIEHLHTYTSVDREGEHPNQQGPASLHCRLWSLNHHWRCNCCWGLSGVVGLSRLAHVIHRWRDPSVDES